jgi:hypothetical protein
MSAKLSPEMLQWLTDNREDYEFYMLHAMMWDPLRRISLLNVPVTPDDFRRDEYAIVIRALSGASKIMGIIGQTLSNPPTVEFLKTYVESAAREEGATEEVIQAAMTLVKQLQDSSFCEQHYCVMPYFEAWYGAARAKKAARELQKVDIPDVYAQLGNVQRALSAASQASSSEVEDPMDGFLDDTVLERTLRRRTGIPGLDECLNGGWGNHECYLIFGGTGSGKSILAGQCAWHEAHQNKNWPLIVSTELPAKEYAARMISNAASIPINLIQDCENVAQIKQAVGSDAGSMYKLGIVDDALADIRARVRIHKVSSDEGMDARMLLEREVLKYEAKMGRKPSWVCLDWLGSVADVGNNNGKSSADRAMTWENAATGCVKFAEDTGIPTVVLAQAVNDSQLKSVLTINDIGISKGIGKNMTAVIGVTNAMDKTGVADAVRGKAEMPRAMILSEQLFCMCKARKGEGQNIQVKRDFRYQRFVAKPKN